MVPSVKKAFAVATVATLLASPMLAVDVSAGEHVVQIIGITFVPSNIIIPVGDTVRWVNNSGLIHTTTSGTGCAPNGLWSGSLNPAAEFTYTFTSAGTYPYFCIPHCLSDMVGTVIAEQAVPVQETTWGKIKALYQTR